MRIGIITNLYPPLIRGGAEWLTSLVAKEFTKQGHQVTVITLAAPGAPGGEHGVAKVEDGVRVYRFNPGYIYHYLNASKHPKWLRLLWHLQHLANIPLHNQIVKTLVSEHCDLIISSNLMGLTFNLPRSLKKTAKTYMHITHDVQLLHPSGLFLVGEKRYRPLEILYQSITRWLFASPDLVIFPSQWLMNEYTNRDFFGNSKKIVLRNPSTKINSSIEKEKSLTLRLLYDGQEAEHKGIFWLIKILQTQPGSNWHLNIVLRGQNPGGEVNSLIGGDSRFSVYINLPQVDIDNQYELADLVIVPSMCMENAPVSITNAFLVSTPVLAARVGGIPELIADGGGILFEAGDAADFNKQFQSIIQRPETLSNLTNNLKDYHPMTLEDYTQDILNLSST